MNWKLNFIEVGRTNRSWSETIKGNAEGPDPHVVADRAAIGGRLMSGDVESVYDPDKRDGRILVGLFRMVGTFTFEPAP